MSEPRKQPRVIVFTTPTCGYCTKAKGYLKRSGVRFREVDITRDPEGARDVRRMTGGSSVPVILVGNRPVVGFDRSKLDDLLGLGKRPESGEADEDEG